MPIHVPAPTHPTNKCPKCGTEGIVQQAIGDMTRTRGKSPAVHGGKG
jgi:hypothetical protein